MKKRLLIVDDEENLIAIYRKLLATENVEIHSAEIYDNAIALINKYKFDALIADLHLTPKLQKEGLKLIESLKKKNKNAICILITAFENTEIKTMAYELGATYCFQKPVSSLILKEALERAGLYENNQNITNSKMNS